LQAKFIRTDVVHTRQIVGICDCLLLIVHLYAGGIFCCEPVIFNAILKLRIRDSIFLARLHAKNICFDLVLCEFDKSTIISNDDPAIS